MKKRPELFTKEERLNYADAFIKVDQKSLDLDFWQEDFLMDTKRQAIILKSRRTGFSFITAMKGLVKAMDKGRIKYVRQFVSYNEDDAKEKINYVKEFYESLPKKVRKKCISATKTSMEFLDYGGKTVSRLISIACRPPRGRGGDIVFDEMGIYPENKARTIYTAGLPVTARGGCVEIGSTPLGKIGMFYDIFTKKDKYKTFNRYTIPWWFTGAICKNVAEAVIKAPEMTTEERVKKYGEEIILNLFDSMLLEDFQQEFECTFVDSAMSFITLDLIYANTPGMREEDRKTALIGGDIENDKDVEEEEDIEIKVFHDTDSLLLGYNPEKHGRLFAGYDVARKRDAAVIFVIGVLDNGKKASVAEIEMRSKSFEYQREQLRKILRQLPVVRVCVDRTGQGEDTTETLQNEFGTARIEGILFNSASKEELAIGVRDGLEKREFLLQNDSKFHRQIHSIKREPTSGGSFRYDSSRDEEGHADSFWAWTLANYAVTGTRTEKEGFYQQLKKKKEAAKKGIIEHVNKDDEPAVRKKGKTYAQLMRDWDKKQGGRS